MLGSSTTAIGDYSTWLIVFKFLGLAIAAGSSIWATVNELTVQDDGRKRLTRSGFIAIGLTIGGLVISIVFEDLQRRNTAREQAARVTAEAKRTNENHPRHPAPDKRSATIAFFFCKRIAGEGDGARGGRDQKEC
jgi:hypothetical protein